MRRPEEQLCYTDEVRAATEHLRQQMQGVLLDLEWPLFAPYIAAINELKRERNAVVLAHNYQTPEIFYGVADMSGDSLALARMASETDADVIVMCGVHFMAETAKLLSPEKVVLIPARGAGCSLADAITAKDVHRLKAEHPGVPVVTYVNTTAAVKAASDICCTSSNALDVVESLPGDRVIFIPDRYLGGWLASQTSKEVILWDGECEVHARFTAADVLSARESYPGVAVLAHPECPGDVLAEADFVGSTSQMCDYVATSGEQRVMLITECSMSDNVAVAHPDVEFVRPCNLCESMKRITLRGILRSLESMTHEVTVDPSIAAGARRSLERMLAVRPRQRDEV